MVEAIYRPNRALCDTLAASRDFDLAEEALHDAFRAALDMAARRRTESPRAWLGRRSFKPSMAYDTRAVRSMEAVAESHAISTRGRDKGQRGQRDDVCAHLHCSTGTVDGPQVAPLARSLGRTTEESAQAFSRPATLAHARARKGKTANAPFRIGTNATSCRSVEACCAWSTCIQRGYSAHRTVADGVDRGEAIRLGGARELLPEPEAIGLLALCCCKSHGEQRGPPRVSWYCSVPGPLARNRIRSRRARLWDKSARVKAFRPYTRRRRCGGACRAAAPMHGLERDRRLYTSCLHNPSTVVELNRDVGSRCATVPPRSCLICAIRARGDLTGYHLAHARARTGAAMARQRGRAFYKGRCRSAGTGARFIERRWPRCPTNVP